MNSSTNRQNDKRQFSRSKQYLLSDLNSNISFSSTTGSFRNPSNDNNENNDNYFLLVDHYKTEEQKQGDERILTILKNDDLITLLSLRNEQVKLPQDNGFDTNANQHVSIISNKTEEEYPMSTAQARYNLMKKMLGKN